MLKSTSILLNRYKSMNIGETHLFLGSANAKGTVVVLDVELQRMLRIATE